MRREGDGKEGMRGPRQRPREHPNHVGTKLIDADRVLCEAKTGYSTTRESIVEEAAEFRKVGAAYQKALGAREGNQQGLDMATAVLYAAKLE